MARGVAPLLLLALAALSLALPGPARADEPSGAAKAAPAGAPEKTGAGQKAEKKRLCRDRPGGINPCMTPDPGFGIYDGWSRNVSMGQLLAPKRGGLTKGGGFDLIVHFHGHEALRKEFVKAAHGIVLVAIDLGIGSGAYSQAFTSPQVFEKLLASVEAEMTRKSGKKATIRRLALSSWSAGYGAVQQILAQPAGKKVDTVILLDSLHAGYAGDSRELSEAGLEPFVAFAREAARGKKLMFQSYSSIIPPGYASTREVAHYLVSHIGGKIGHNKRRDVLGLELDERFDRGNYHVRGYLGDDKPDHCAHLGLIRDVLKTHLNRRWNGPRGYGDRRKSARAENGNQKRKEHNKRKEPKRGQRHKPLAKRAGRARKDAARDG